MQAAYRRVAARAALLALCSCGAPPRAPVEGEAAPPLARAAAPTTASASSSAAAPSASAATTAAPAIPIAALGPLVSLADDPVTAPNAACPQLGVRGWRALSGAVAKCGYAIPVDAKDLPPPIAWGPCSRELGLPEGACRQIVTRGDEITSATGGLDAEGRVVLALERRCGARVLVVADADGPVRNALYAPRYRGQVMACAPEAVWVGQSVVVRLLPWAAVDATSIVGDSAGGLTLGARLGDLHPRVLDRASLTVSDETRVSDDFRGPAGGGVVSGRRLVPTFGVEGGASSPAAAATSLARGTVVLGEVADDATRVLAWSAERGERQLWTSPRGERAHGFGTDGEAVVFSVGRGPDGSRGWQGKECLAMALPLAASPGAAPRALGTYRCPYDVGDGWVVKGDVAAVVGDGGSLTLVDLRAGTLRTRQPRCAEHDGPCFRRVLAVTSDEVFVHFVAPRGGPGGVARIRIAAMRAADVAAQPTAAASASAPSTTNAVPALPRELTDAIASGGADLAVTCAALLGHRANAASAAERPAWLRAMRAARAELERALSKQEADQYFASTFAVLRDLRPAELEAGAAYCRANAPLGRKAPVR